MSKEQTFDWVYVVPVLILCAAIVGGVVLLFNEPDKGKCNASGTSCFDNFAEEAWVNQMFLCYVNAVWDECDSKGIDDANCRGDVFDNCYLEKRDKILEYAE